MIEATIYANPQTFFLDAFKVFGGALVIVTVLVTILAYLYGAHLANPLAQIIDGIQRLAQGDYHLPYQEAGLYASVYGSLNSLTEALRNSQIEHKRLETARDEWIANISHDVKTPLSSLRGYAELLADPDYHFNEDEVRKYAQIMHDKSIYMEGLIEDLRLTYQLKNAALPIHRQTENLAEVLRETVIDLLNDPALPYSPGEIPAGR